jgi:hypothetical protein
MKARVQIKGMYRDVGLYNIYLSNGFNKSFKFELYYALTTFKRPIEDVKFSLRGSI